MKARELAKVLIDYGDREVKIETVDDSWWVEEEQISGRQFDTCVVIRHPNLLKEKS